MNILILFCHQCLGLPSGLFPLGFPTRTVRAFPFSPCAPHCHSLLSLLAVSTLAVFKVYYSLCSCCHPALIDAIIIERLVFVINLCSSLNASDQVSHPYRTTGDIIVQSILIFMFLEIKSRLKLGNACYYSVQNLLSSSLLSKKLKIKVYRTTYNIFRCSVWV